MPSASSVAIESLRLPKDRRYRYVQDQMTTLIGRPVSRREAEAAIREAEARCCPTCGHKCDA